MPRFFFFFVIFNPLGHKNFCCAVTNHPLRRQRRQTASLNNWTYTHTQICHEEVSKIQIETKRFSLFLDDIWVNHVKENYSLLKMWHHLLSHSISDLKIFLPRHYICSRHRNYKSINNNSHIYMKETKLGEIFISKLIRYLCDQPG